MAFKGLAKLSEECGEVVQVVGKAIQVGDLDNKHWSGDLRHKLEDEIADVLAAARFVIEHHKLDMDGIEKRSEHKYTKFCAWEGEK